MTIKNLSLVSKQVLGFGLILVIMVGVNIFSLIKLSQLKQDVDDVTKLWLPSVIAVSEIDTKSSAFRISELQHTFSNKEDEMLNFESLMIEKKEQINLIKDNYEPLLSSEKEKELYLKISAQWQRYTELNDELLDLSKMGMKEEAAYFYDEALQLFNDLKSYLNELVTLNKKYAFDSAERANTTYNSTRFIILSLLASTIIISILISIFLVRAIIKPIQLLEKGVKSVAEGKDEFELKIYSKDEIGNLAFSFNKMTKALRKSREENQLQDWIKSGQNQLNEIMRGDMGLSALSRNVITFLAQYIDAQIGALYLWKEDEKVLRLLGSYAFSKRKLLNDTIRLGEGLVGQTAMEKQIISVTNIPEGYIEINSSLGSIPPKNIIAIPFLYENQLVGVIELGTLNPILQREMDLFDIIMKNIAMSFNSANSRNKIRFLLEESQIQAKELQKQQLRLRNSNQELEEQTLALKESEAALQAQREELQTTNEELEEKTDYLERHKKEIVTQNTELEAARNNISKKAEEMEEISKYKSEFLANMSHELRTPLNSLLILARNLTENSSKNLTPDQIESSKIIYNSGNDLLELINDILDLSKIEAGKMSLNLEKINLNDFKRNVFSTFSHMIQEKGLDLEIEIDNNLPEYILSDYQKITQVIKNLMSNSIKFTTKGNIKFHIFEEKQSNLFTAETLLNAPKVIGFSVKDTGIGIRKNKLIAVFEAFQQADGSTSRKFGGTGLGLSISSQLVKLLGGEIKLQSKYGEGSEFSFFIPSENFEQKKNEEVKKDKNISEKNNPVKPLVLLNTNENNFISNVDTEKDDIFKDKKIMIVDDDMRNVFALSKILKEKGLEIIKAEDGKKALQLLKENKDTKLILMDIMMPVMDGYTAIKEIRKIKEHAKLPIIALTAKAMKEDRDKCMAAGSTDYLSKPVDMERLLSLIRVWLYN